MSIPAPEGFLGSQALERVDLPVGAARSELEDLIGREIAGTGNDVHSGIHAILPGPPIGNEGLELNEKMELDFDDNEKTHPCIDVDTLMAQIEHHDTDPPRPDAFDDETFVGPVPSFLEETQDELPVLDEGDEVDPITERNPVKTGDLEDVYSKPTWPKMPVANSVPTNVDDGTERFQEAIIKALTTDPDDDFSPVTDDEIEVVK